MLIDILTEVGQQVHGLHSKLESCNTNIEKEIKKLETQTSFLMQDSALVNGLNALKRWTDKAKFHNSLRQFGRFIHTGLFLR